MSAKTPYVLAISSFAVHGTASLKVFTTVLGERLLPVPSIVLNGLTNMALVKKFETPFEALLQSTFELAVHRDLDLILYIGYLGSAAQAAIIVKMIDLYGANIRTIITDPVCGDNGRTYVPHEVIAAWPALISRAHMVFPNITELGILTGFAADDDRHLPDDVGKFKKQFPDTELIVTSIKAPNGQTGIGYYGTEVFEYFNDTLPRNYGGTGDVFLAMFIVNFFYNHLPMADALKTAACKTYRLIKETMDSGADDLLLSTLKN